MSYPLPPSFPSITQKHVVFHFSIPLDHPAFPSSVSPLFPSLSLHLNISPQISSFRSSIPLSVIITERSLPLLFSLAPSISPGCGVLHPGSVFRVITCLVNSFMDSTLSVTHTGHMPAHFQCNELTYTRHTLIYKYTTCGFILTCR